MKDKRYEAFPKRQCVGRVMIDSYSDRLCLHGATIIHEGKWYCGSHDPARLKLTIERRRQAVQLEISKEKRVDLCVSVLSDFSDTALSSGVVGEMVEMVKDSLRLPADDFKIRWKDATKSILSKLEADK